MDPTAKAAVIFAVLGAISIAGAQVCKRLQARLATSILVLGLNLVGAVSLASAALVFLTMWKGLSRPG